MRAFKPNKIDGGLLKFNNCVQSFVLIFSSYIMCYLDVIPLISLSLQKFCLSGYETTPKLLRLLLISPSERCCVKLWRRESLLVV